MSMPNDVGAVDLLIGFPSNREPDPAMFGFNVLFKDDESRTMEFPAEHLFTQHRDSRLGDAQDPVEALLEQMDRHNIEIGLIGSTDAVSRRALADFPERFRGSISVDPNDITGSVRAIRAAYEDPGIVAVQTFPAGCVPQVAVSDRKYYPIYQTCIDLDIPIITNAGVPGPRVPMDCQHVRHFDEVCYDFPELRIVMRHGAEPWEDLAVKLMLKWPGLHYCTSAFAPKYYPKAIIEYANSRGADKIMYAGYYPMGLTLDRIFRELEHVPLRDEVWPKFLRDNAYRVFKLDER